MGTRENSAISTPMTAGDACSFSAYSAMAKRVPE